MPQFGIFSRKEFQPQNGGEKGGKGIPLNLVISSWQFDHENTFFFFNFYYFLSGQNKILCSFEDYY